MRSGRRSTWWGTPDRIGGAFAMLAQGVHCVDLLHFLLGQHVVEVAAMTDGQTQESPLERLATLCSVLDNLVYCFSSQQGRKGCCLVVGVL